MYEILHIACSIGVIVTSCTNTILNISLIIVYIRMSPQTKKKTANILLLNQACADLSALVPAVLWSVWWYLHLFHEFDPVLHEIAGVGFAYCNFTVILSLAATTVHRSVGFYLIFLLTEHSWIVLLKYPLLDF